MPNPYAGATGYNAAIRDAIRAGAAVTDNIAQGDEHTLEIGCKILCAIAGLMRRERQRRATLTLNELIARASDLPEMIGRAA